MLGVSVTEPRIPDDHGNKWCRGIWQAEAKTRNNDVHEHEADTINQG